jgi:hypothetical protein
VLFFSSKHLEAHFLDRGSEWLLITFNEMGMKANGREFWAKSLAERLDISAVGFVSHEPNWFPRDETVAAIRALNNTVSARFPVRVGYGLSQGAHAILRYKSELRLTVGLAFSPQASIDPSEIADPRFNRFFDPNLHSCMIPTNKSDAAQVYVFYDPMDDLDRQHVVLMRGRIDFVEIALPFIGHSSSVPFAKTSIMQTLFTAAVADDHRSIREICAIARRCSPSRPYLLCHHLHKRHPVTALRVFEKYRDHSNESWWLIARLLALSGQGSQVIQWITEKCNKAPTNAEILACGAMVAIEIGDKIAAVKYSDAAVKLEPNNQVWQWVRGNAIRLES